MVGVAAARPAGVLMYSKPGCHLCDDMREQVRDALESASMPLRDVDISTDPALEARYRHDIPVLLVDGEEIARHRISDFDLHAALRQRGVIR